MEKMKLLGNWFSPFACRVIWALELKGIEYELVEEDLTNKSSLLLQYNPVHKKIPVLIHNEKSICESLIILEYLEEIYSQNHPLLPNDPYERAMARFWAKFVDEKGLAIWTLFRTTGEEQQKARTESLDMLKTIEEKCVNNREFFGGENIGLVDIVVGAVFYWLIVIEDVLQIKLLEPNTFPSLHSWFNNFKEVPMIKKNLPDQDKMFIFFNKMRQMMI